MRVGRKGGLGRREGGCYGGACMHIPTNVPTIVQQVAPVRKALGVRTAFNIVGPLLNAAGAQHVVVGVFQEASHLSSLCALAVSSPRVCPHSLPPLPLSSPIT